MIQKTFAKAILDAGLRMPGESAATFLQEIKKLTADDRAWFKERFRIEHDIEITS